MKKIIYSLVFMFAAFALSNSAFAQDGAPITAYGYVYDAFSLDPIIGASVTVKGTRFGTLTDRDGNFYITAPKKSILVISFIGYKTQKIVISSRPVVRLEPEDLPISANSENNVSTQFLKGDKALEFKNDK